MARWATILFLAGCALADLVLLRRLGFTASATPVLFKVVLLELEIYIALWALLMTFRVVSAPRAAHRLSRRSRRRK